METQGGQAETLRKPKAKQTRKLETHQIPVETQGVSKSTLWDLKFFNDKHGDLPVGLVGYKHDGHSIIHTAFSKGCPTSYPLPLEFMPSQIIGYTPGSSL